MGFIPEGARWYLADIVLECTIEDESRNVVHVNTHLIEADLPEQAYEKAIALGRASEQTYENTDGGQVRFVFRGLRELNVVHDDLEDGAELSYTENIDVPEEKLRSWILPKEQLGVFAPIEGKAGRPNYIAEWVMRKCEEAGFRREDVE